MKSNEKMILDSIERKFITKKEIKISLLLKLFRRGEYKAHRKLLKRLDLPFILISNDLSDTIARK